MSEEIPKREKAKEGAKRRDEPKAVDKARENVKRHVEREKPGPKSDRITPQPDTDPRE